MLIPDEWVHGVTFVLVMLGLSIGWPMLREAVPMLAGWIARLIAAHRDRR